MTFFLFSNIYRLVRYNVVNLDVFPEEGRNLSPTHLSGRCGYFPLISQSQWTAFFSTQCCSLTKRKWKSRFFLKKDNSQKNVLSGPPEINSIGAWVFSIFSQRHYFGIQPLVRWLKFLYRYLDCLFFARVCLYSCLYLQIYSEICCIFYVN